MKPTRGYCILICCLLLTAGLHGQERDTLDIYKRIRKSAYKHKFTKLLYQAIFVEPVPQQYESKPLSDEQKQTDPNARFAGKIIGDIRVIVYDPFGHAVNDTFTRKINKLQKAGNSFHITTRQRVIRNILLFRIHDTVQIIRITESERLLRQASYINDARIFIEGDMLSDSVTVTVKVLDKWNYDAAASGSTNGGYVRIRDRNVSGWGQTYEQRIAFNVTTGWDFRGNYNVANIKRTYISSDLYYQTNQDETKTGIAFNRPFYSPLARWAWGAEGSRTWGIYRYSDTTEPKDRSTALNYYNQDYWLGRSFALGKHKKTDKISNIALGARYAMARYLARPSFAIDSHYLNADQDIYLASIGYSLRKYYKDQFIYRFGANEDVPEGIRLQATYGVIQKQIVGLRNYYGFDISNGKHLKGIGYISVYAGYGTLFRQGHPSNSTINSGFIYFTDLYQRGKWYFRNFVNYKLIKGINKMPYERLTLQTNELYGFAPGDLTGTGKMLLNLEAVAYAPYNIIGFKFAPVALAGFGILENGAQKFSTGKIYQAYSVGLLVRNENLLNSSFEFSVGFYPELPGPEARRDVFRLNPIGSFSLKVRSFDISKPGIIAYE